MININYYFSLENNQEVEKDEEIQIENISL